MSMYDTYYGKHCGRYYGWLPASEIFKRQLNKKSLKYFTLCAKEAIDVFMLEMEGILSRDKNKKLPDVIICEKEPGDAAEILDLVRPPLKDAIIVGELERILTFQDTDETKGIDPDDPKIFDARDLRVRNLLRIKGLYRRLEKYFPFDIINFDPYGNLLNPGTETNILLYQSFEKIFELQESINTFLLFITTPITNIHARIQSTFRDDFESNVSRYPKIRNKLSPPRPKFSSLSNR